jgi:hypothetical protein
MSRESKPFLITLLELKTLPAIFSDAEIDEVKLTIFSKSRCLMFKIPEYLKQDPNRLAGIIKGLMPRHKININNRFTVKIYYLDDDLKRGVRTVKILQNISYGL